MPLVVSKTTQNFLKTLHKPLRLSVGITIDLKANSLNPDIPANPNEPINIQEFFYLREKDIYCPSKLNNYFIRQLFRI